MELRKKLDENIVVSATYLATGGLSLRIKSTGDNYDNAVAHLEMRNGKPVLSLCLDTIEHYGIKVTKEHMQYPDVW